MLSDSWHLAVATASGLLVVWLAVVAALYVVGRRQQERVSFADVARLLPDVLRLLRRLAADPTLPRGLRLRLGLVVAYLLMPVDLVPDFIPIVGYADDLIIVAIVLRSVIRSAGADALDRHWPGTPGGLTALKRIARA